MIRLRGPHYLILSGNTIVSKIEKAKFPTKAEADIECSKILHDYCKNSGKLINEYRFCYSEEGTYLEVKVGKVQIQCDSQILSLIEKYEWFFHISRKYVYRKDENNQIKLIDELAAQKGKDVYGEFIDGNYLNYKLKNLRFIEENTKKNRIK